MPDRVVEAFRQEAVDDSGEHGEDEDGDDVPEQGEHRREDAPAPAAASGEVHHLDRPREKDFGPVEDTDRGRSKRC